MNTGITVVPLAPGMDDSWNTHVENSGNGTLFHRLDFLAYHPANRFSFHHLLFYKHDQLVAVLPGAISDGCFRSPMGASAGGFATPGDLSLADADAIVKAFIAWCREQDCSSALLTPPLRIYQRQFNAALEYALLYNGFTLTNPLHASVIDCMHYTGRDSMKRKIRYNINKALRDGVRVEQSREYDTFYPILLENKAKFNVKPTHTLDELNRIESLNPDAMTLFMAYLKNEPIAGVLVFNTSPCCALNFYTMHRYAFRKLYPNLLLLEHCIAWCHARGVRYFDFGVNQDTFHENPMEPSWSLVSFKESLGAVSEIRVSYQKQVL